MGKEKLFIQPKLMQLHSREGNVMMGAGEHSAYGGRGGASILNVTPITSHSKQNEGAERPPRFGKTSNQS